MIVWKQWKCGILIKLKVWICCTLPMKTVQAKILPIFLAGEWSRLVKWGNVCSLFFYFVKDIAITVCTNVLYNSYMLQETYWK